jgi:integrase
MIRGNVNPIAGADMPRPRPPFVHSEITRHGRRVWYFRRGQGPRIRLPDYGAPDFADAYAAALAGEVAKPRRQSVKTGSLRWLVDRYRDSGAWTELSMATRRARENIFKRILESAGDEPFAAITRADIVDGRDRRRETPFAANDYLKTLRALFKWAVEAQHVDANPCDGVRSLSQETTGFHAWTEEEVAQFEARWPIGTRERLALAILLYSGLRRGDASQLGRQHVRSNVITMRTEKTGAVVHIPVRTELAEIIAATPSKGLAFVSTPSGKGMTKESFGNWFKDACKAAKVPGSAHGLRKLGATRLANAGASVHELQAVFGWESGRMAEVYTKEADRIRLARQAMEKLETRTSIPAPPKKCGS